VEGGGGLVVLGKSRTTAWEAWERWQFNIGLSTKQPIRLPAK
jgi:hypothetical protein